MDLLYLVYGILTEMLLFETNLHQQLLLVTEMLNNNNDNEPSSMNAEIL